MEEGWRREKEEWEERVRRMEAEQEEREREREEEREGERRAVREKEEELLQLRERQAHLEEQNTSKSIMCTAQYSYTCMYIIYCRTGNICGHEIFFYFQSLRPTAKNNNIREYYLVVTSLVNITLNSVYVRIPLQIYN